MKTLEKSRLEPCGTESPMIDGDSAESIKRSVYDHPSDLVLYLCVRAPTSPRFFHGIELLSALSRNFFSSVIMYQASSKDSLKRSGQENDGPVVGTYYRMNGKARCMQGGQSAAFLKSWTLICRICRCKYFQECAYTEFIKLFPCVYSDVDTAGALTRTGTS